MGSRRGGEHGGGREEKARERELEGERGTITYKPVSIKLSSPEVTAARTSRI